MCMDVEIYQLGKKFIKNIIGSFLFKVMNSPIYSIQREVIKEFESLVSNLAFALWFHKWKQKEQAKLLINCLFSLYELSPWYA